MLIHASAVDVRGAAVLITGEAQSGKSSLCAQLMGLGARLIADDQVHLSLRGDALFAAPPEELAGLIELSGLGIVDLGELAAISGAPVLLGGRLSSAHGERLPKPACKAFLGVDVPWFEFAAQDASLAAKLMLLTQSFQQFGSQALVDVAKRATKG